MKVDAKQVFRKLCDASQVGAGSDIRPDWYRAGENIEVRLPALSTYLGHRYARSTASSTGRCARWGMMTLA